jgi:hypothetical protein
LPSYLSFSGYEIALEIGDRLDGDADGLGGGFLPRVRRDEWIAVFFRKLSVNLIVDRQLMRESDLERTRKNFFDGNNAKR